jgi:hypothetical protein
MVLCVKSGAPMLKFEPYAVQWHLVDGEVIGLDVSRGEYFAVNESGATLWSRLAEGATEQGLVDELRREYGLSGEAAEADVATFLYELHNRRLLAGG